MEFDNEFSRALAQHNIPLFFRNAESLRLELLADPAQVCMSVCVHVQDITPAVPQSMVVAVTCVDR